MQGVIVDRNNLKELLAQKARLQDQRSELTTNALKAIESKLGLIDSDLETVTGLISEMVEAGAAQQREAQAKETGAVNFVRDGIKVTHNINKSNCFSHFIQNYSCFTNNSLLLN